MLEAYILLCCACLPAPTHASHGRSATTKPKATGHNALPWTKSTTAVPYPPVASNIQCTAKTEQCEVFRYSSSLHQLTDRHVCWGGGARSTECDTFTRHEAQGTPTDFAPRGMEAFCINVLCGKAGKIFETKKRKTREPENQEPGNRTASRIMKPKTAEC